MKIINGNIFDSKCDFITNPINIVGVMGKGLALEFKKRYPKMFETYKKLCQQKTILMGNPVLIFNSEVSERDIILFPTKKHWKDESKIIWIKIGLEYLKKIFEGETNVKSIAFPLLGCGLGGLKEEEVLPLIEQFEKDSGIECEVYKKE